MARIRSHHPGLWTTEPFVECSFGARLLWLGLENQADDQGIFEWRPRSLRMAIFPADNVDIDALLGELASADLVRSYEVEGKRYGVIWEFGRRQKPKSPNAVHPMPSELRSYAGCRDDISEPLPQRGGNGTEPSPEPDGNSSEIRSLMERRGKEEERREDSVPDKAAPDTARGDLPPSPTPAQMIDAFDRAYAVTWPKVGARVRAHNDARVAAELIAAGWNAVQFGGWCQVWLTEWARKGNTPAGSLNVLRVDALAWISAQSGGQAAVSRAPTVAGAAINWDAAGADAARLAGAG